MIFVIKSFLLKTVIPDTYKKILHSEQSALTIH